jgi:hypothetical protein
MTSTASPDAPAEVVRRRAHRRRCEAASWVAHGNITAEQARTVAARLRRRLEDADPDRQPRLCVHLAALAESEAARAADAAATAVRFTPLAEHAAEVDYRAEAAAQVAAAHAEALTALVLDLEALDIPAAEPHRPRLVLDLPPPGRLVRCSPMAAHAPPAATARGRSRWLGLDHLLKTVGGN